MFQFEPGGKVRKAKMRNFNYFALALVLAQILAEILALKCLVV